MQAAARPVDNTGIFPQDRGPIPTGTLNPQERARSITQVANGSCSLPRSARSVLGNFTTDLARRVQARREQELLSDGTPDRPGAYQVTAAAAAAVGRYGNAAPPLCEPEAIAVVGIDKDQLPADIIGRTAKTPNNSDGYPVVHAENVREAYDIPLVRAYRADLLTPNPANDSSL